MAQQSRFGRGDQELVDSYTYSNGTIQILLDNDGSTSGSVASGNTWNQ